METFGFAHSICMSPLARNSSVEIKVVVNNILSLSSQERETETDNSH